MKMKLLIMFLLIPAWLSAQELSAEVVSSSGGDEINSYACLSWTMGELAVETLQDVNVSLYQGFQQVRIDVASGFIDENYADLFDIQVFPNPVYQILTVSVRENRNLLFLGLYDLQGRLIHRKFFNGLSCYVDLTTLMPSSYVLKISDNENKLLGTYNIVKY